MYQWCQKFNGLWCDSINTLDTPSTYINTDTKPWNRFQFNSSFIPFSRCVFVSVFLFISTPSVLLYRFVSILCCCCHSFASFWCLFTLNMCLHNKTWIQYGQVQMTTTTPLTTPKHKYRRIVNKNQRSIWFKLSFIGLAKHRHTQDRNQERREEGKKTIIFK